MRSRGDACARVQLGKCWQALLPREVRAGARRAGVAQSQRLAAQRRARAPGQARWRSGGRRVRRAGGLLASVELKSNELWLSMRPAGRSDRWVPAPQLKQRREDLENFTASPAGWTDSRRADATCEHGRAVITVSVSFMSGSPLAVSAADSRWQQASLVRPTAHRIRGGFTAVQRLWMAGLTCRSHVKRDSSSCCRECPSDLSKHHVEKRSAHPELAGMSRRTGHYLLSVDRLRVWVV